MSDFDNLIPGWFKTIVQVGNDLIWSQYLIGLLLTVGFFFTISSKFVQLRMLPEMFRALTEKPETLNSGEKVYHHSKHLQLVGSRVGTGNIACSYCTRWSWCSILDVGNCFYRCASAFMEATLAQIYKVHDKEGGFRGGPYYITKGLNQNG